MQPGLTPLSLHCSSGHKNIPTDSDKCCPEIYCLLPTFRYQETNKQNKYIREFQHRSSADFASWELSRVGENQSFYPFV